MSKAAMSGRRAPPKRSGSLSSRYVPISAMWRLSIAGVAEDRMTGMSSNIARITAVSRA